MALNESRVNLKSYTTGSYTPQTVTKEKQMKTTRKLTIGLLLTVLTFASCASLQTQEDFRPADSQFEYLYDADVYLSVSSSKIVLSDTKDRLNEVWWFGRPNLHQGLLKIEPVQLVSETIKPGKIRQTNNFYAVTVNVKEQAVSLATYNADSNLVETQTYKVMHKGDFDKFVIELVKFWGVTYGD
jgi:hypothetical protein